VNRCPYCNVTYRLPDRIYVNVRDFGPGDFKLHCPTCHKPIRVEAVQSVEIVRIEKSRHRKDDLK
jgi:Zn-finger nucleic acid-binding protein